MRAIFGSLLVFLALGCTPTRAPVQLTCFAQSDCPADGMHLCNVQTHRCEPCDGKCAELIPDIQVSKKDVGEDTGDTGTADTGTSDTGTATDVKTPTSCKGLCFQNTRTAAGCYCDTLCVSSGDCCDDYVQVCLAADGSDADGSGGADTLSGPETSPTPDILAGDVLAGDVSPTD